MIETAASTSRREVATSATYGAELTFETVVPDEAAMRVHQRHDVLLRVVAGSVRLAVGAQERVLETGEEAIVPAGRPHRIASASTSARVLSGLRKAA